MNQNQIKHMVENASVENTVAFAQNVAWMLQQELSALRMAAMEGPLVRCPDCNEPIVRQEKTDLILSHQGQPNKYRLEFHCPECDSLLGLDFKPMTSYAYRIPF